MVEVFNFMLGRRRIGCGTKVEFEYWQGLGVFPEAATLGKVIASEPASEDERRKAAWATN